MFSESFHVNVPMTRDMFRVLVFIAELQRFILASFAFRNRFIVAGMKLFDGFTNSTVFEFALAEAFWERVFVVEC
jgi:hypothetical protein